MSKKIKKRPSLAKKADSKAIPSLPWLPDSKLPYQVINNVGQPPDGDRESNPEDKWLIDRLLQCVLDPENDDFQRPFSLAKDILEQDYKIGIKVSRENAVSVAALVASRLGGQTVMARYRSADELLIFWACKP